LVENRFNNILQIIQKWDRKGQLWYSGFIGTVERFMQHAYSFFEILLKGIIEIQGTWHSPNTTTHWYPLSGFPYKALQLSPIERVSSIHHMGTYWLSPWKCKQYQVHLITCDYTPNQKTTTHITLQNKFTGKYGVFPRIFFLVTRQKVSANCKVRGINISVQVRSNKLNSEYNIYINNSLNLSTE
jgi:hypothetical protein